MIDYKNNKPFVEGVSIEDIAKGKGLSVNNLLTEMEEIVEKGTKLNLNHIMSHLILVRHGQSIWNLEKKFTGWVDVDLTENGKLEAKKAGNLIRNQEININLCLGYNSL